MSIESFRVNLKRLRKSRGWTQAMLAERVGCVPSYIGLLESGGRNMPSGPRLSDLANALGVSLVDLVEDPAENGEEVLQTSTPPRKLRHRWYLAEWSLILGRTQADAVRELGWNKSTASHLWNGKQRYSQDYVDEIAVWLNIRPYELLMPPDVAMAFRRLQDAAVKFVDDI